MSNRAHPLPLLDGHRLNEAARPIAIALIEEFNNRPASVPKGYSPRNCFNLQYPTEFMLERHGFVTRNGIDWRHPSQTSASYGTRVWPDGGWSTQSETVGAGWVVSGATPSTYLRS